MLEKDPKHRISAKDALRHKYFIDVNCDVTPSPQLRSSVLENMNKLRAAYDHCLLALNVSLS
jgi:hypothetical protein